jgi:hypothetical protein|tara:strand:+ start:367 stop:588 length:222 start_codon:yes stop_codon:yes gene_type:complete
MYELLKQNMGQLVLACQDMYTAQKPYSKDIYHTIYWAIGEKFKLADSNGDLPFWLSQVVIGVIASMKKGVKTI